MVPETRYAKAADGSYLAYQAFGQGNTDLLWLPGFASHLEVFWEYAPPARFLRRLATFSRVIWFDKRGTGLSDRVSRIPDLETMLDDALAVLDAAGSEQAVLFGEGADGGGTCAVLASSFPERAAAFIWWHGWSRSAWAPEYPWGVTEEQHAAASTLIERSWGTEEGAADIVEEIYGSSVDDPEAQRWWAKLFRYAATPAAAIELQHIWYAMDVRSVLPAIQVPTMVISRFKREEAAFAASQIPGATLVELPFRDSQPWRGDQESVFTAIGKFLESVRRERATFDRVLATVLFTDIVDSTSKASELGDRRWKELVERHHAIVRGLLARYRGQEVDTAGDGFFATFDGPARAVRCARAIIHSLTQLGLEVRAGVHTGEVEMINEKLGGIAAVIGARVGAVARPSEVLASSTVRDLTVGSGLLFEDRGEHTLKGVPGEWHLYAAVGD